MCAPDIQAIKLMISASDTGWAKGLHDALDQWIQIDFLEDLWLLGIITWGRGADLVQYVSQYTLTYYTDGGSFLDYMENGAIKVSHIWGIVFVAFQVVDNCLVE